jgi:hypothetical protein
MKRMNVRKVLVGLAAVSIMSVMPAGGNSLRAQDTNPAAGQTRFQTGEHDIVDLLENGIIEAKVSGRDITYVNLRLRRTVSWPVSVRIPVGSFFVSENTSKQNMVATAEKKIRLASGGWQSLSMPAACANRPRGIPGGSDNFSIQRSPNQEELARLMPVLNRANPGTATKQAAVWIVTDNATYDDLGILVRSFSPGWGGSRVIGYTEAARAMKICADAGIDIKGKRIWKDWKEIFSGLPAGELRNRLHPGGLAPVRSANSKWGFVDKTGREVIPCKYDEAEDFSDGLARVQLNGKKGYVDRTGQEVIPCKYDRIMNFFEGLAEVQLNGKWGYIDRTGQEVTPCKYDETMIFSEGLAKVKLNGNYGYIDKTGQEVIPCKYDRIEEFSEGLAEVRLNGKKGYVDKTGQEVIPCKYDDMGDFSEGLAKVQLNGNYGYIDKTGQEVIPCKYDRIMNFSEGLAKVQLNGNYGYIDKTGQEVIPCKYDYMGIFSEGLASVLLNGKLGYIDKTGKEVIPCKYDRIMNFSKGLASVQLNNKWGYIDKTGKEVIPIRYDRTGPFENGKAEVTLKRKTFFIDRNGNKIK